MISTASFSAQWVSFAPAVLLAPDQAELRHRPAGLGVGHAAGDDQLGVERDDVLAVRRGQRDLSARHVAALAGVVEHDVPGRTSPFEPAVLVGVDPERERPVPAPGVGADEGTGDRLALDVNDLAAEGRGPAPRAG